jgi:dephospho-CoA kinase
MVIVGLTGLMGSGKSFISEVFASMGVLTYNTDTISKMVQVKIPELRQMIIDRFGEEYFNGKTINKEFAIPLLYSGTPESMEKLKWMTESVGKYVLENLLEYKKNLEDAGVTGYIIVESAILYETGFNSVCDYIIGVKSNNPVRATYNRDYTTKEEWNVRMSTQLPESEKKFDFVIGNDYTDAVKASVSLVHEEIMKKIS